VAQSVASVSTVFNSQDVLPRQLEALLRQTRPLQEIIVVDNASTDDTVKMLGERFPQVTVLRMPENLGHSGAAAAGIAYAALEKRHDWVWSFDDDSIPDDNALVALLEGVESVGDGKGPIGIAASLPVNRATGECYYPLLWRDGYVKPSPELLRQPIWLPDLVIFSGCMVSRDAIEKIGLPRADFFSDFDDFEYCLRARSHGYRIAVVTHSRIDHEIGNPKEVRFFGFSRFWPDPAPWREYYIGRNIAYAAWWLYPNSRTKRFVMRYLIRRAGGVLFFGSNKLASLTKMAQGFWDGRRAVLGIRFLPSEGKVA
jgi:GT2 family glycosyltransferase